MFIYITAYGINMNSAIGHYIRIDKDALQDNMLMLRDSAQTLTINGANEHGFPFKTLYDVIGNKWNASATLLVSVNGDEITFTSTISGEPLHGYSQGYNIGTLSFWTIFIESRDPFVIKLKAATVPGPGEFFLFSSVISSARQYYVWFSVDNNGEDPKLDGLGIKISISSSDTIAEVLEKISNYFNNSTFTVPSMLDVGMPLTEAETNKNNIVTYVSNLTKGAFFILLESGAELLLENGDQILLEISFS
jgi:hypothetical protein